MPASHCPPDLVTMDIQVQPNLHYGVNGGHESTTTARSYDDENLRDLSLEEKECILFFDSTIEEALQNEGGEVGLTQGQGAVLHSGNETPVVGGSVPPSPVQASTPVTEHPHSTRDGDIIDLVHPTANQSRTKESPFDLSVPDFQNLVVAPESHFELRPKRDPQDNFPSNYHLSASSAEDSGGRGGYQPPAGSIPTPVVIAQKLAVHQGDSMLPSMLVNRRRSLDSTQPVALATTPSKQGPPTSAKPTNINMLLGNRELNHSVGLAAVSAQERRAQKLANLGGAAHPMEGGEPPCMRNTPTRSVSFRDPTPDKSHLEALSKLGLVRGRAKSMTPGMDNKIETKPTSPTATTTSMASNTSTNKTEIHTDFNRYGGKSTVVTPSLVSPGPINPPSPVPPVTADVGSRDFNTYGGKTIVVVPAASASSRATELNSSLNQSPPPAQFSPPPIKTDAPPLEVNSYGGRTKTIIPASALARAADATDGPASNQLDTRASVPAHTPSPPATVRGEPPNASPLYITHVNSSISTSVSANSTPSEFSHYGGKSKVITPAAPAVPKAEPPHRAEVVPPTSLQENRTRMGSEVLVTRENSFGSRTRVVAPGDGAGAGTRGKSATLPPTTAPKPSSAHRVLPARLPSPEARPKAVSKPSFRSQGITVQFSGRGATDESRREALRRLGLLKNTSLQ